MRYKQTLHQRLKFHREKKNFSQEQLANYLGITRQSISNWETGKSYPDIDNLILLCKLYDITVDELLDGTSSQTPDKVDKNNLCELPTLNPSDSNSVSSVLSPILEMLCFCVVLALFSQFPILGIISPIFVFIWLKKNNRKYKIVYLVCIICLIIGIFNTYTMFDHLFFKSGTSTIMPESIHF